MPKYRLKRYLGIVFIAVVIAPAIVLSLVALRAISHEEAYIEKQIEGTLSAEVAHVSGLVTTELDRIQSELASTIVIPEGQDAADAFREWKQRTQLVEIPFLLSPTHDILWPASAPTIGEGRPAADKETSFLQEQQAFLENEEQTPVYENIAVAYKNDILGDVTEPDEGALGWADSAVALTQQQTIEEYISAAGQLERAETDQVREAESEAATLPTPEDRYAAAAREDQKVRLGAAEDLGDERKRVLGEPAMEDRAAFSSAQKTTASTEALERKVRSERVRPREAEAEQPLGEKTRSQTALSQFQQSEPVRKKVYDKAEREGQQVFYRNIQIADAPKSQVSPGEPKDRVDEDAAGPVAGPAREAIPPEEIARTTSPQPRRETPTPSRDLPEPEGLGSIRSIFISQPQSFSDIVAKGTSGIIPRTIDGSLQLLYWQKALDGNIVGCLVNSEELRERIIGALPGIYSSVRILTVLDERGQPLVVPPGQGERDWRRPFVAEEISEILPRWEVASYLTDPDVISSEAQVATSLMWVVILILFVAILAGGTLVVRSTYAEMRLAQQKTSFVANVSHELKTPLTSIRLFAEMLRDGRQPDEHKQRQYLDIMTAETERLTRLVNNVLDFSRMERGEKRYTMRRCDLVDVSAGIVESQRARLENNGFEVVFTTHAGSLFAQADEEALKQALVNLLSNAEKYSSDTKQIEVDVKLDDGNAVIAISDRGIGIPPGDAERIFDEFYRVDDALTSKVKGAGLGLTIARRIMRDHGGDLRYSPREGGGSTFELLIPLAKEET